MIEQQQNYRGSTCWITVIRPAETNFFHLSMLPGLVWPDYPSREEGWFLKLENFLKRKKAASIPIPKAGNCCWEHRRATANCCYRKIYLLGYAFYFECYFEFIVWTAETSKSPVFAFCYSLASFLLFSLQRSLLGT